MNTDPEKISFKLIFGVLIFSIILGLIFAYSFNYFEISKKFSFPAPTPKTTIPATPVSSFADLVEKVSPAVVNISTTRMIKAEDFFGDLGSPFEEFFGKDLWEKFFGRKYPPKQKQRSLGSGFIVSSEGYILTNAHVVKGAEEIKIRLANGKTYAAEIIGQDEKTDLALLKAKTWFDFPQPVKLGDSNKLRVGDWVIAIGNPFGLDHTVTVGIVSAKGRVIGAGPYDDFIQTDASINPGNSGGPLFNLEGEVIGINNLIYTTSGGNIGIGFAVPINMAKEVMDQLKNQGKVTRGWIGVSIQELTPELAETFGVTNINGVLITDVIPNSPAYQAGLKPGDIITKFNGKQVAKMQDLSRLVSMTPIGKSAKIEIIREKEKKTFSIIVKEKEETKKLVAETGEPDFGLQVEEVSPELAQRFGFSPGESGVIVTEVEPGGVADQAGLKVGDIIKEIDKKVINSINDFKEACQSASAKKGVLIFLTRKEGSLFLVLKEK